jgi:hypothetical protein
MTMAKASWKFVAVVSVVMAAPFACFVGVDDGVGYGPRRGVGTGSGAGGGNVNGGGGSGTTTGDECNPVTNAGCPSDGTTCDADNTGRFVCFPPPNSVPECGPCDGTTTFCGPDLTCVVQKNQTMGTCYRYCCADADCGMGGTCDTALAAAVLQPAMGDKVGLCTAGTMPACGAPPPSPPSKGACIGGFSKGAGSSSASSSGSGTTTSSSGAATSSSSGGTTTSSSSGTATSSSSGSGPMKDGGAPDGDAG